MSAQAIPGGAPHPLQPETVERQRGVRASIIPFLPLVVLIGAVSADRFGIRVGSLNVRFELIAAALLLLWIVAQQAIPGRIGVPEWAVVGWLAATAVASVIFSPARSQSLKYTILLAGMVALFAATVALVRSREDLTRAATVWVAVGGVIALIGVIETVLYILVDSHVGIAFDGNAQGNVVIITPKLTSTMWEANILGSYMLIVWAMALALSRAPEFQTRTRRRLLQAVMVLATCNVVLANSRAVWIVGLVLAFAMAWLLWRLGLLRRSTVLRDFVNPGLLGIIVGLVLVLAMAVGTCPLVRTTSPASPSGYASVGTPAAQSNPLAQPGCTRGGSAFLQQFRGFFHPGQVSSFTGRAHVDRLALQGWLRRPILGWGAGAFVYVFGPGTGGWIGNLELHLLFDSGLIGFLFLAVAFVLAAREGVISLQRAGPAAWSAPDLALLGLLAAGAALLGTYQFTEGTWLGFTWVFFGLLVAAGRVIAARTDWPALKTSPSA